MTTNRTMPLSPNLRKDDPHTIHVIRLKYKRTGPMAYTAHLDMLRLFERAVSRSGLPIAYSQGFNPRPLMIFALPIGVGVETTGDYLELEFKEDVFPKEVMQKLNGALPHSVRITEGYKVPRQTKSIMALVKRADYVFEFENIGEMSGVIDDAKELEVVKKTKKGLKKIDIRPLILNTTRLGKDAFKAHVMAGSKDNLRPDLLLTSLAGRAGYTQEDALDTLITRTEIYADYEDGKGIRPVADGYYLARK